MRTDYSHGDGWGDELRTERVLAESGRKTRTLSEARRAAVLQVLLAEAARLKELSMRAARHPGNLLREFAASIHPTVARVLVGTMSIALALSAYALFGGARLSANAKIDGVAAISENRRGPFGLQWSVAQLAETLVARDLHRGDDIVALTPITITYSDGSKVVAFRGAHLELLQGEGGLTLLEGEIASVITKSSNGTTKFSVQTAEGVVNVKGTEFRVRAERNAGVTAFIDHGFVSVANDVATVDVTTGEQVRLQRGVKPVTELQTPRLSFDTRSVDAVVSNKSRIPFEARIYPGGTLIVSDATSGVELARLMADAEGNVRAALPEIVNTASLHFRQEFSDGRTSANTTAIKVQVDRIAPALSIMRLEPDGNVVKISGRTETKAEVRVNGVVARLNSDGTFVVDVKLGVGVTSATISATDLAGNTTTMVQSLR